MKAYMHQMIRIFCFIHKLKENSLSAHFVYFY